MMKSDRVFFALVLTCVGTVSVVGNGCSFNAGGFEDVQGNPPAGGSAGTVPVVGGAGGQVAGGSGGSAGSVGGKGGSTVSGGSGGAAGSGGTGQTGGTAGQAPVSGGNGGNGGNGGAATLEGDATPDKVACGSTSCDLTTSYCCIRNKTEFSCIALNKSCMALGGSGASCDGPEDCEADRFCCGRRTDNGHLAICSTTLSFCEGATLPLLCHNSDQCSGDLVCCPTMFENSSVGTCRKECQ